MPAGRVTNGSTTFLGYELAKYADPDGNVISVGQD
jgi:hypothetical protein